MASRNQLAEVLASKVGKAHDAPFKREMKVLIDVWRSRLLKDTINANPQQINHFKVSFSLELEKASATECNVPSDCKIYRTKDPLPVMLRTPGTKSFLFVGSALKTTAYPEFEFYEIPYMLKSKYIGKGPMVVIDEYAWLFNRKSDTPLFFQGIIDNLDDLRRLKCGGKSCLDDDDEYPVTRDIQQRILQAILATELAGMVQSPSIELKVNE